MAAAAREPLPIRGSTALLAVLGDPVRHSLSPALQNAALRALGLDWIYLALPTPAARLGTVLDALEATGCRGLNITIPHKQAVVEHCRELSPLARRLGAVNTLVPHADGGWFGTNTDVEGFCAPLRRQGRDWCGSRAVVLGCGGSAKAVVAGLVDIGCASILLAGRRRGALEAFQAECAGWAPQLQTLHWHPQDAALRQAIATADLVVNTTPVGMASASDASAALACPLQASELEALPAACLVYDILYIPRPTTLLQQAAAYGCPCLDGLAMLVGQGAAALRLWSGIEDLPVERMQAAALDQLASHQGKAVEKPARGSIDPASGSEKPSQSQPSVP